jgi:hypothetical protein
MLQETDVKKFIYIVIVKIKLFQMLESLDALDLTEFATCQVEHSNELERGTDVSETPNK